MVKPLCICMLLFLYSYREVNDKLSELLIKYDKM